VPAEKWKRRTDIAARWTKSSDDRFAVGRKEPQTRATTKEREREREREREKEPRSPAAAAAAAAAAATQRIEHQRRNVREK